MSIPVLTRVRGFETRVLDPHEHELALDAYGLRWHPLEGATLLGSTGHVAYPNLAPLIAALPGFTASIAVELDGESEHPEAYAYDAIPEQLDECVRNAAACHGRPGILDVLATHEKTGATHLVYVLDEVYTLARMHGSGWNAHLILPRYVDLVFEPKRI